MLFRLATSFTMYAMCTMIIAFITGTYAVLHPVLGLAISICLIVEIEALAASTSKPLTSALLSAFLSKSMMNLADLAGQRPCLARLAVASLSVELAHSIFMIFSPTLESPGRASAKDAISSGRKGRLSKKIVESLEDVGSGPFGFGPFLYRRDKNEEKNKVEALNKVRESHLVVAALIATVTFAAAFTLPGGYKSDQGTAILAKKAAFIVFVISDAISMVLSISAVFLHFLSALYQGSFNRTQETTVMLFRLATSFTMYAMCTMIIAFITGTYAVLHPVLGLAISICLIVEIEALAASTSKPLTSALLSAFLSKSMMNLADLAGQRPCLARLAVASLSVELAHSIFMIFSPTLESPGRASAKDAISSGRKGRLSKKIVESLEDVGSGPFGFGPFLYRRDKNEEKNKVEALNKVRESHLVVAALIATVTFAAAFTLPGGYKSDQGTAILAKKAAFIVFVISDAISMVLSISAVFLHFLSALYQGSFNRTQETTVMLFRLATSFTMYAMCTMIIAFITGTYAVLHPVLGLAISICLIVEIEALAASTSKPLTSALLSAFLSKSMMNLADLAGQRPCLARLAVASLSVELAHSIFMIFSPTLESPGRASAKDAISSGRKGRLSKKIVESLEDVGSGPFGFGPFLYRRDKNEEKNKVEALNKVRESHLVVAALIATVTFAAAFTLPGGYKSDQGTAILAKKAAFIVFVISDAISMVLSISAVFLHFLSALYQGSFNRTQETTVMLFRLATSFTMYAMCTMIIAFITGTYAVLHPVLGLAISICLIGLGFFLLLYLVYWIIREDEVI
ncbi:hypothetical protein DKX38_029837 [Salix brachista]|uniref:PGG domain-containing protein n=1 Tax=Salix brachista TaxID=2182728 RepID=A0A5N5J091_9ROSI|nr:hypothetical protein DKX38_029837 [Salix brachista]